LVGTEDDKAQPDAHIEDGEGGRLGHQATQLAGVRALRVDGGK
jgi:hypothetical protein